MAPQSFASCLGGYLEHTGPAVTALTKSSHSKGSVASLAVTIPPAHCSGHSFHESDQLCLLKGHFTGIMPELGHRLPDCQGGVSAFGF